MKSRLAALALTLALSTSACYRATFYRDPGVIKGTAHEQWTDFYVFGLVGEESFDVRRFCSNGDAAVLQTGGNFATGLVSVLTIGIYTPRKVYVTCTSSTPARARRRLELSADGQGRLLQARLQVESRELRLSVTRLDGHTWRLGERID